MFVYLLLWLCACVCVCQCQCCLSWWGRSLLPVAQWLMEINVWFAGYLIKDLMLKHAPTLSCPTHSKEIASLSPLVHFASTPGCVCKVVAFASDHGCVVCCLWMCQQVIRSLWLPDVPWVHSLLVYACVCVRCPEAPTHPPLTGAPCSQCVCIDQTLEWRNACPAHKINGYCFLSSNGLLLSAMNTKHIL